MVTNRAIHSKEEQINYNITANTLVKNNVPVDVISNVLGCAEEVVDEWRIAADGVTLGECRPKMLEEILAIADQLSEIRKVHPDWFRGEDSVIVNDLADEPTKQLFEKGRDKEVLYNGMANMLDCVYNQLKRYGYDETVLDIKK